MPTETELKLRIPDRDILRFKRHPLLKTATKTAANQHLCNTSFDTPNHDFREHGMGLRIRRIGRKRIQTLKAKGQALNGLHQRQEWETEVDSDEPDLSLLPEDVEITDKPQITPIFTTDFKRSTWDLDLDSGEKIEIALDHGEIKTSDQSIPLHEVELELKNGDPEVLYEFALQLQQYFPLTIENHSKAERGYALSRPQPLCYSKAGHLLLPRKANAEKAFMHIIWHCLEHLQKNQDVVLYGDDIEGVHQMRVALRRLRSCLSLYKALIPADCYADLRTELKWITEVLGVARDWDVFELNLQQLQNHAVDILPLSELQRHVKGLQEKAYVDVREALQSPRYSRLLLSMGQWLTEKTWRSEATSLKKLKQPAKQFASQLLQRRYEKILRLGECLFELPPEERHELRIEVKKLSYGCRFFSSFYPKKITQSFLKAMANLQEDLGVLNDIAVSNRLMDAAHLSADAPARHFLNGWYASELQQHMAHLRSSWDGFVAQKRFWK